MDTMPALNSQVIKAAGVALISLIAIIVHLFWANISESTVTATGGRILDAVLLLIPLAATVWAMLARAFLPNPPLSQSAADAHDAILVAQGIGAAGAPMPAAASSSSASSTVKVLAVLLTLGGSVGFAALIGGSAVLLAACTTEPVSVAVTPGQKAAAILGDYNVYADAAVTIGQNTGVPVAARKAILDAVATATPIASNLDAALRAYRTISAQLLAGTTTADKLAIATTDLNSWVAQISPILASLEQQVAASGVK